MCEAACAMDAVSKEVGTITLHYTFTQTCCVLLWTCLQDEEAQKELDLLCPVLGVLTA